MIWKIKAFTVVLILISFRSFAQQKTEAALIARLFESLQRQDVDGYEKLYANTDSLSSWILQYADPNSESYKKMYYVKNDMAARENYDTIIRRAIHANLDTFLKKAKMMGVRWSQTVFVRYELDKIRRGRGLMIEKVAPLRFLGYIYFKDNFTRKKYAFTVYDIMQVNNSWYAGELVNIFEASNKEEYQKAKAKELQLLRSGKYGLTVKDNDSTSNDDDGEDTRASNMKEVADRKFYRGKFDNEISVQLYVRYIKGPCPGGVCSWEALFKFGDQDEWVPMSITKTPDGNWLFTEELGGMELTLEGAVYTGTWAAGDTKAEYDVTLKETSLSTKKANALDAAMDEMTEPNE